MRHTLLLTALLALAACGTVAGTGRRQFILTTPAMEAQMGQEAFTDVMATSTVVKDGAWAAMVERCGQRLAKACGAPGFQWEFKLVQDDTINAFCLPGGKVVIYTGIMPHCANEAGLATVMGHEIAHAVARHGGERMTQGVLVQGGALALDVVLQQKGVAPTQRNQWMAAFGMGSQIGVLLPYSRKHEYEADYLGMTYLAKAGYDPAESPRFWERFAKLGGERPPEFLSTHPADEKRAAEMRAKLPELQALAAAAPAQLGIGETIQAAAAPTPPASAPKPSAPAAPKPTK